MNADKTQLEISQEILWSIKQVITAHAMGFNRAKKAKDIVELVHRFHGYKITVRNVRSVVNHCRNNDLLPGICAKPHVGYWIAESSDEIQDCIESLRSRIIHQLQTYRNLKLQKLRFELKEQKLKNIYKSDRAVQPGSTN